MLLQYKKKFSQLTVRISRYAIPKIIKLSLMQIFAACFFI